MDIFFVKRVGCLFNTILLAFIALLGWQAYWHLAKSDELLHKPTNRRLARMENQVPRGAVFDRNDVLLAKTVNGARQYADARATANVLGYINPVYDRVGLEAKWNRELSGFTRELTVTELRRMASGEARRGNDLVLTLDLGLQQAARDALGEHAGAIVVLDAATGGILAMATAPTYDPSKLDEPYWQTLNADARKPLLNRATQEFYPPGSTMKLVTASAALMHNRGTDTTYTCEGSVRKYGVKITDFDGHRHGTLAMPEALRKSCNNYFAQLAAEMPADDFSETATNYGFGRAWWTDRAALPDPRLLPLPVATSALAPRAGIVEIQGERAHMGFGQSTVVATPLQMAMVAAGIANDGTVMAPYLVTAERKGGTNTVLKTYHSGSIGAALNSDAAHTLAEMMKGVVYGPGGTGHNAQVSGLTVYGKTGTAQQEGGKDHAWFVGFAEPASGSAAPQRIAFAVLIERGGSTGGQMAAPIARQVLQYWRAHHVR